MCTLALYFKVFPDFPLVVAANRDEQYARPSVPPAVLQDAPTILAGRDIRAGGTWLGINEHGLVAAVLNRHDAAERQAQDGPRSRGLLCLDALQCRSVTEAMDLLAPASGLVYRPFTLVCADRQKAWAAYNTDRSVDRIELENGLHVFSNSFETDAAPGKAGRAHSAFSELGRTAQPALSHLVGELSGMLADHSLGGGSTDVRDAVCVHGDASGTVSASIVVYAGAERRFRTFYCPGKPCQMEFREYPALAVS